MYLYFNLNFQRNRLGFSLKLGHGMDGLSFESWKDQEFLFFSKTSRPSPGPTQPHIKLVPGFLLGAKVAGP
jgi:hypothetical protein